MKNAYDDGSTLDFTAPVNGVVSGQGYIIGDLFVISSVTAVEDKEVVGEIIGAFKLAAVLGDVAIAGAKGYWDDAAKNVTLAPAAGANKMIGTYATDKTNTMSEVAFRLNGVVLA